MKEDKIYDIVNNEPSISSKNILFIDNLKIPKIKGVILVKQDEMN